MPTSLIQWLQEWYRDNCNGDWEHQHGIDIKTLDNPGWDVAIDLRETELSELEIKYELIKKSEDDWYGVSIEKSRYEALGDPTKLELLLETIRQIAESHRQGMLMAHLEHAFPGRWQIKKSEESNSAS